MRTDEYPPTERLVAINGPELVCTVPFPSSNGSGVEQRTRSFHTPKIQVRILCELGSETRSWPQRNGSLKLVRSVESDPRRLRLEWFSIHLRLGTDRQANPVEPPGWLETLLPVRPPALPPRSLRNRIRKSLLSPKYGSFFKLGGHSISGFYLGILTRKPIPLY